MSFVVTDSSAKNIYKTMRDYYAGQQMPDDDTGVFFGFANYTRPKLIYTIEFLKRQYGLGWFTTNMADKEAAFNKIANALYTAFDQTVSRDGIKKFCNWVLAWARKDEDAAQYFAGTKDWGVIDALFKSVGDTVSSKISNAVETVEYGLNVPSFERVTPTGGTLLKWGLIVGGGFLAVKYVSKKLF